MQARAPWRLGAFSERALERELAALRGRKRNAPLAGVDAAGENGWLRYYSEAVVAREPPGRPVAGGAFEKARTLVERYEFSDPRVVAGHFDARAPLDGRTMVLELKVLGIHYLCGVRVVAVRDSREAARSVFGFAYDTLEGHLESGSEWFVLTKDHASGDLWFRIEASWRPSEFPNAWSRVGFALLGRSYQRAWHRLAYLRLRRMLDGRGLPPLPRGRRLLHPARRWRRPRCRRWRPARSPRRSRTNIRHEPRTLGSPERNEEETMRRRR